MHVKVETTNNINMLMSFKKNVAQNHNRERYYVI